MAAHLLLLSSMPSASPWGVNSTFGNNARQKVRRPPPRLPKKSEAPLRLPPPPPSRPVAAPVREGAAAAPTAVLERPAAVDQLTRLFTAAQDAKASAHAQYLKLSASNAEAQAGLAELRETREAGKGGFSIFGKR